MTNDELSCDDLLMGFIIKHVHKIWKNSQSCKIKPCFFFKDPVIIQYAFESITPVALDRQTP